MLVEPTQTVYQDGSNGAPEITGSWDVSFCRDKTGNFLESQWWPFSSSKGKSE